MSERFQAIADVLKGLFATPETECRAEERALESISRLDRVLEEKRHFDLDQAIQQIAREL